MWTAWSRLSGGWARNHTATSMCRSLSCAPICRPGKKGTEADIVGVLGLVGDFDDADAANYASRLPVTAPYVLETSPGRFQTFLPFDRAGVGCRSEGCGQGAEGSGRVRPRHRRPVACLAGAGHLELAEQEEGRRRPVARSADGAGRGHGTDRRSAWTSCARRYRRRRRPQTVPGSISTGMPPEPEICRTI